MVKENDIHFKSNQDVGIEVESEMVVETPVEEVQSSKPEVNGSIEVSPLVLGVWREMVPNTWDGEFVESDWQFLADGSFIRTWNQVKSDIGENWSISDDELTIELYRDYRDPYSAIDGSRHVYSYVIEDDILILTLRRVYYLNWIRDQGYVEEAGWVESVDHLNDPINVFVMNRVS